jgi:MSHA biogenesis protein MshI
VNKPPIDRVVGITHSQAGLHLSLCKINQDFVILEVLQQHFIALEGWQKALYRWLKRHNAVHASGYVVLESDLFQSFVADKPDVEQNSVTSALRWSVNELVQSEAQVSIDYYDVPVAISGQEKVHVIAVPEQLLDTVVRGCHHAHLELKHISVPEVTCRQLVPYSDSAVLLLQQTARADVSAFIIKQGKVYHSRKLNNVDTLHKLYGEELRYAISGNFGVELQRSMDYFDSQMRQAPVQKIYVNLALKDSGEFCQLLSSAMFLEVEEVNISLPGLAQVPNPNFLSVSPILAQNMSPEGAQHEV